MVFLHFCLHLDMVFLHLVMIFLNLSIGCFNLCSNFVLGFLDLRIHLGDLSLLSLNLGLNLRVNFLDLAQFLGQILIEVGDRSFGDLSKLVHSSFPVVFKALIVLERLHDNHEDFFVFLLIRLAHDC